MQYSHRHTHTNIHTYDEHCYKWIMSIHVENNERLGVQLNAEYLSSMREALGSILAP